MVLTDNILKAALIANPNEDTILNWWSSAT